MALTNTQHDELMRSYQQKQLVARHQAATRKQQIYAQYPALAQLDQEISSMSVKKAKEYIAGNTTALTGLEDQIALLTKQKEQILTAAGFPLDIFHPQFQCPDCQDTGYINNKKCHCFLQAELEFIYQQSNIKNILARENFNTFSLEYYPDDLLDPESNWSSLRLAQSALIRARSFVTDFEQKADNLLFYGNTGTGKTFLTNCIAKELLDAGHSVIYFSAFQLFDVLAKATFDKNSDRQEYDAIFNCDLLIIDDLGTEVPNAFTTSKFFQCINERILRGKSTIISTNLTLKNIADIYSERVSSRITSHFTLVKMFGKDIRIQKKLGLKSGLKPPLSHL